MRVALPGSVLGIGLIVAFGAAAAATTGYRCTDASGRIAFQDKPCTAGHDTTAFQYERGDGAIAEAPPAAPPAPAPAAAPSVVQTPIARPPVPPLFRCVRADNEKVYYSDTGDTAPYAVPAGVLGIPSSSLAENAHVSAPELNRTPIAAPGTSRDIAAAYVQVQDRCVRMSPAEACRQFRVQLDQNLARQRSASGDEREGIRREAQAIAEKLAGC
ncbi:DUF4124 domain-containing protein [Tahibacter amnicola]|uniref:DUF4124 domain-containing protein n=1 Tax=Tahibacter amnicola TaxID=2976241 RepID=A0ABY6BIF3_9GAMM|nr:DUF4124 domain-containing protein [Tahibacter amnicola]UXI69133.1 DUF4124 domain-containing protein [Tahibacter amnicola]